MLVLSSIAPTQADHWGRLVGGPYSFRFFPVLKYRGGTNWKP